MGRTATSMLDALNQARVLFSMEIDPFEDEFNVETNAYFKDAVEASDLGFTILMEEQEKKAKLVQILKQALETIELEVLENTSKRLLEVKNTSGYLSVAEAIEYNNINALINW